MKNPFEKEPPSMPFSPFWIILILLALVGILFFTCPSEAQELHVIALNKADSITVNWQRDGLDIDGNVDKIKAFDLYSKKDSDSFVYVGSSVDSVNYNPAKNYTSGQMGRNFFSK